MSNRTLGWVQNASDFDKLHRVVSVFDKNTNFHSYLTTTLIPQNVPDAALREKMINALDNVVEGVDYSILKGIAGINNGVKRSDSICSGIIQLCLPNQKGRPYSDDWSAECFIRWAVSLNLLKYNAKKDTVQLSSSGLDFIKSTKETQKQHLVKAVMCYGPAIRILELLKDRGDQSKFELASYLGGLGEPGFTSIGQDNYIRGISFCENSVEKSNFRSNVEGSSDKYARMICSWLNKLNLIELYRTEIEVTIGVRTYREKITKYSITYKGEEVLKKAQGNSRHPKISKNIYFESLSTKGKDKEYLRLQRAHILTLLSKGRGYTSDAIAERLSRYNIHVNSLTISSEIEVLRGHGIRIDNENGVYYLRDTITNLHIPNYVIEKPELNPQKIKISQKLISLNHKHLCLVDFSCEKGADRDFEISTNHLFNDLGIDGIHLGGSNKPDNIIYQDDIGIIIDNKAYSNGFSLPRPSMDEMIRYLQDNSERNPDINPNMWWNSFESTVKEYKFLFIAPYFINNFESRLVELSYRTNTKGGVISVENLLYVAEKIKSDEMSFRDFYNKINNCEVMI